MNKEDALKEITRLQRIVENFDAPMPKPLENPKWDLVKRAAISHIEELNNGGFADENSDHWFYEAVMEAVYGNGVWDWINNKTK